MPVSIKRSKDILTIEVGDETFKCKWLNERIINKLYAQLGEYDENTAEFNMQAKNYSEYCYNLASKIIIGWEVVDEEGNSVRFDKRLILDLNIETVDGLAEKYMNQRMGITIKRDAEEKNSESTSPSAGTSRTSKGADDVRKITKKTT